MYRWSTKAASAMAAAFFFVACGVIEAVPGGGEAGDGGVSEGGTTEPTGGGVGLDDSGTDGGDAGDFDDEPATPETPCSTEFRYTPPAGPVPQKVEVRGEWN